MIVFALLETELFEVPIFEQKLFSTLKTGQGIEQLGWCMVQTNQVSEKIKTEKTEEAVTTWHNDTENNLVDEVAEVILIEYPVVLVIVAVVGPPAEEEEDHGEDHEHQEDGAGVNIDGDDSEARQSTRD